MAIERVVNTLASMRPKTPVQLELPLETKDPNQNKVTEPAEEDKVAGLDEPRMR